MSDVLDPQEPHNAKPHLPRVTDTTGLNSIAPDAITSEANTQPDAPAKKRLLGKKGFATVGVLTLLAIAVGGGTALSFTNAASKPASADKPAPSATTDIKRGTLSASSPRPGTLTYSTPRNLDSTVGGTLTGMAGVGDVVGFGQRLWSLDNNPTILMRGTIPAWRSFESGMSDGPDVHQLEQTLQDLGYLNANPSESFNFYTSDAIKRWQKDNNLEVTGSLAFGSVVFSPEAVRVGSQPAQLADSIAPGSPILAVTGVEKQVHVDLKLADQQLAKKDNAVEIDLPGGVTTTGRIVEVGAPTEKDGESKKETVIPVRITLDDPAAAGELQEASVTVKMPSDTREDVLYVPVGALLSLNADQFGVEVVKADGSTKQVPVTTGLFAGGEVEISGDDISEGQKVVVPEL